MRNAGIVTVHALKGGPGTVTLAAGRYSVTRIDPRTGERTALGEAAGGAVAFDLPAGQDWVLLYRQIR